MKRISLTMAAVFILAGMLLCPGEGSALPLVLDYTGFTWTTTRDVQHFWAVGVLDGFSQPVNDPAEVYTYFLSNLTLASIDNPGSPQKTYHYSGGDFSVFKSTGPQNRGYDYGTYPANGTSPSTFIDGALWLQGALSNFTVTTNDNLQLGILTANGVFTGGEFAPLLGANTFFDFAGLTARGGNGIPDGYAYRMDGQVQATLNPPVPEPATSALLLLGISAVGLGFLRRRRS